MTKSVTCPVCIRQDSVTFLDSTCILNGHFKSACLLRHQGVIDFQGRSLGGAQTRFKTLITRPLGRIVDFVRGRSTASAQTPKGG